MLEWFRKNGSPRELEAGQTVSSMATPSMLRREHFFGAYLILCSVLFSCCYRRRCCSKEPPHGRLMAGTRTLSADGTRRGDAWGGGFVGSGNAENSSLRGLLVGVFVLILVTVYSAVDVMVAYSDGLTIQSKSVIPVIEFSYMSLAMLSSFLIFILCILSFFFAFPALYAADPRRRYDRLLHPLAVAAQCDDWLQRSAPGAGAAAGSAAGEAAPPPEPAARHFFTVLLAYDPPSAPPADQHPQLPAIVGNVEGFLAEDVGVTVRRSSVAEALERPGDSEGATVTVLLLTSAWAVAAWLQGAAPQERQRHVIAVCNCCVPPDSSVYDHLFVAVCDRGPGAAAAPSRAEGRGERSGSGAGAPLLQGGGEGGAGSGECACVPNPSFARDLVQAIATKVPVVLLSKGGEAAGRSSPPRVLPRGAVN